MSSNEKQTPSWMFFAADGSYGDATGLHLVRSDDPVLEQFPDDPRDREVREFGQEHGSHDVWVLVVADGSDDTSPGAVTVHATEKDAIECLRVNYLDDDQSIDDDDVIAAVTDQYMPVSLESYTIPQLFRVED